MTYELKLAIADYRRGISEIRQFTKSKTESVHLSAEGVQAALKSLVNQHQKLIALITAAADRQDPLPNSTSDIVVKLNQSWQLLIRASIAASYALMEPDPSSGTMRLNITQNQKEALMEDLEKNFGPPIKQGLQEGQRSLEAAAATLYAFLQEPWPTKPE